MSDPEISNILKNLLKNKPDKSITAVSFAHCYEDAKVIDWLQTHGLEIPLQRPSGRNLTPMELRALLKKEFMYVSYAMPLGGSWTATVREMVKDADGKSRYRLLEISGKDYTHEDSPVTLTITGNADLVRPFLDKAVTLCGPLVLMQEGEVKDIIGLTG